MTEIAEYSGWEAQEVSGMRAFLNYFVPGEEGGARLKIGPKPAAPVPTGAAPAAGGKQPPAAGPRSVEEIKRTGPQSDEEYNLIKSESEKDRKSREKSPSETTAKALGVIGRVARAMNPLDRR
jgi:hypothetical protein